MKKLFTLFFVLFLLKTGEMQAQFAQIDCTGIQIQNILELTEGTTDVYFIANMNARYTIAYSSFHFTYKNGNTSSHYGSINPQGNPIYKLQTNCNNPVTDVQVYVQVNGNCSLAKTKHYIPPICSTGFSI